VKECSAERGEVRNPNTLIFIWAQLSGLWLSLLGLGFMEAGLIVYPHPKNQFMEGKHFKVINRDILFTGYNRGMKNMPASCEKTLTPCKRNRILMRDSVFGFIPF
jgi:hypothetical protein